MSSYPLANFLKGEEPKLEDGEAPRKSRTRLESLLKGESPDVACYVEHLASLKTRWPEGVRFEAIRRPGVFGKADKRAKERGLQRQILSAGVSHLADFGEVEWMDLEVPVDYAVKKARRTCPDLVGWIPACAHTVIVELKAAAKRGGLADTPLHACFEAIAYARTAHENAMQLRESELFHANAPARVCLHARREFLPIAYKRLVLVVAADAAYWDAYRSWLKKKGIGDGLARLRDGFSKAVRKEMSYVQSFDFLEVPQRDGQLLGKWNRVD